MATKKKAAATKKKAAPAKKTTTARKAVAGKKAPAKKVPVKKVAAKRPPAKKLPAKKTPAKRPAARSGGGENLAPIPGEYKLVTEFVVDQNGVLFFKFGTVLMSVSEVIAGNWSVALVLEKLAAGQTLSPEAQQMLTAFANYLLSGDDAAPTVYVSCCP
jgi:hypothetical protein